MATTADTLMTAEEFLALPNDGMERWLICGQLREKPMTYRNRWHSWIEARIVQLLGNWLEQQPSPHGEIYCGEVGCRLTRDPATVVGIDVAYVSAELSAKVSKDTTLIDGAPILAVEILSPLDKVEEINEKVDQYLEAGVALVWLVDSHFRTVHVHRPGAAPESFNVNQEISAEPHLPGFKVLVARIFER